VNDWCLARLMALNVSLRADKPRCDHQRAVQGQARHVRMADRIGDAELVIESEEHHTLRAPRPLTHRHPAGPRNASSIAHSPSAARGRAWTGTRTTGARPERAMPGDHVSGSGAIRSAGPPHRACRRPRPRPAEELQKPLVKLSSG